MGVVGCERTTARRSSAEAARRCAYDLLASFGRTDERKIEPLHVLPGKEGCGKLSSSYIAHAAAAGIIRENSQGGGGAQERGNSRSNQSLPNGRLPQSQDGATICDEVRASSESDAGITLRVVGDYGADVFKHSLDAPLQVETRASAWTWRQMAILPTVDALGNSWSDSPPYAVCAA
eukprot:2321121-Pleurochrysis_carterae.AAC.1